MNKSPLRKTQDRCKKLVKQGKMTKEEAMMEILQVAMDMIEALKIPENKPWEVEEYAYMARKVN